MKRLFFIYNPFSGKAEIKGKLAEIVDIFTKAGYSTEIYPTQGRMDARNQVMERGGLFDLIVCSGGDGTLNEVASGLLQLDRRPPLGYIPAGSTNDFAASVGLTKRMEEAARTAVSGFPMPIDMGRFNDSHFVYVAGFGAFTDVSYNTSQNVKKILGHSAYILEGLRQIGSIKPHPMKITWENGSVEDEFILGIATNSHSVGGFRDITGQNVDMSDGLFEVTLVRRIKNPMDVQRVINYVLDKKVTENATIMNFKARSIRIESADPVPWTLDGEYGGSVEAAQITNLQRAIRIMVSESKND